MNAAIRALVTAALLVAGSSLALIELVQGEAQIANGASDDGLEAAGPVLAATGGDAVDVAALADTLPADAGDDLASAASEFVPAPSEDIAPAAAYASGVASNALATATFGIGMWQAPVLNVTPLLHAGVSDAITAKKGTEEILTGAANGEVAEASRQVAPPSPQPDATLLAHPAAGAAQAEGALLVTVAFEAQTAATVWVNGIVAA